MNTAARILPQEHENRWIAFWAAASARFEQHGLVVDLLPKRARVMRRQGESLVLLDSFSIHDTPERIETRLAELVGGAA